MQAAPVGSNLRRTTTMKPVRRVRRVRHDERCRGAYVHPWQTGRRPKRPSVRRGGYGGSEERDRQADDTTLAYPSTCRSTGATPDSFASLAVKEISAVRARGSEIGACARVMGSSETPRGRRRTQSGAGTAIHRHGGRFSGISRAKRFPWGSCRSVPSSSLDHVPRTYACAPDGRAQ